MSSLFLTPLLALFGVFGYAIYSADPDAISIGKISSSGWVAYSGYDSKTLGVMLQSHLMALEQTVESTREPKYRSEDKVRDKAVEVMTESLQVGKPVKAIQYTLGFIPLEIGGSIVENNNKIYLYLTGYANDGNVYKVKSYTSDITGMDGLIKDGIIAMMEQVDPYFVADYWFRTEKKDAAFPHTRKSIQDGLVRAAKKDIPRYYNLMGEVLHWEGQYELAILSYQQALSLDPSLHRAHLHWAQALIKLKRFEEAKAQLKIAGQLDPTDADVYSERGALYVALGDPVRAMNAFAEALKVDPHDADAYYEWSGVLLDRGRAADAVEALRRAVFLEPKKKKFQVALDQALAKTDKLYQGLGQAAKPSNTDTARDEAQTKK